MDVYCEQNVENTKIDKKHKKMRILGILRYVLLVIGIVICYLLIMSLLNYDFGEGGIQWGMVAVQFVFAILSLVPFVLSFIFIGRYVNNASTEFDYLINSGVFRIMKVVNRKKRKKMLEFQISSIESIGKIESESYDRYASSREIKKIFAICDYENEDRIYYLQYNADGAKYLVHIEPNDEMLIALKRSVSRISIIDKSVKVSAIPSGESK